MDDRQAKKLRKNDVLICWYNFKSNQRIVRLIRKFPETSQALVQDLLESYFDVVGFASLELKPVIVNVWMAGWKKKGSKRPKLIWSYKREEVKKRIERANKAKNMEWVTAIFEHVLPPE